MKDEDELVRKKDLVPMKDVMSTLQTDVSGLKTDVSELKTDVSKLKTDVSELKTDVSELKTDVSEIRSDISEIKFDLRNTEKRLCQRMDGMDKRMDGLLTKSEFDIKHQELLDKMYTKDDHAKFMIWMDEAMTELRDAREGRKLNERQMLRTDDIVADHELRIRVLEN